MSTVTFKVQKHANINLKNKFWHSACNFGNFSVVNQWTFRKKNSACQVFTSSASLRHDKRLPSIDREKLLRWSHRTPRAQCPRLKKLQHGKDEMKNLLKCCSGMKNERERENKALNDRSHDFSAIYRCRPQLFGVNFACSLVAVEMSR